MKRRKSKEINTNVDSTLVEVRLPFTYENLKTLLLSITKDEPANYTQYQVADWCNRFRYKFLDEDVEDIKLKKAIEVADDVDCQWDLHLCNSYLVKEHKSFSYSEVELPKEMFKEWLRKLDDMAQPNWLAL